MLQYIDAMRNLVARPHDVTREPVWCAELAIVAFEPQFSVTPSKKPSSDGFMHATIKKTVRSETMRVIATREQLESLARKLDLMVAELKELESGEFIEEIIAKNIGISA